MVDFLRNIWIRVTSDAAKADREMAKDLFDKGKTLATAADQQVKNPDRTQNAQNLIRDIAAIGDVGPFAPKVNPAPAGLNLADIAGGLRDNQSMNMAGVPFDELVRMTSPTYSPIKPQTPPTSPSPTNGKGGAGRGFGDAERSTAPRRWDPLVLDLGGDGITLTQLSESNAYFDFNSDGFREKVGWVGPNEGILVLDKNNDGLVNNGNELFGTQNISGFEVLKGLDTNNDHVINLADLEYTKLKVWRDLNGDGLTQNGELKTLAEYDITSISLASVPVVNPGSQITQIVETATFSNSSQTKFVIGDAFFQQDFSETVYNGPQAVSVDAGSLPNIRGFGLMPNFQVAATLDSVLINLYGDLVGSSNAIEFNTNVEKLLLRWAGADDVDSASRGGLFDARLLSTIEAFFGRPFVNIETGDTPSQWAVPSLVETWTFIKELYTSRFLVIGGPLSELFPDAEYSAVTDSLVLNADVAEIGIILKELRQSDLSKFEMIYSNVQLVLRNSTDSWNQSILFGTEGADQIFDETTGGVFVTTGGGADSIQVNAGKSWIDAGDGNNVIQAGDGDHVVFGGNGNDILYVGNGKGLIDLGNGANQVNAGDGSHYISTGSGVDNIYAGNGNHTIQVGDGKNTISVGNGNSSILGGLGDDSVEVGNGNSVIYLLAGNNNLFAGDGDIVVRAGDGTDIIQAGNGSSDIDTGSGDDYVTVGNGNSIIDVGSGSNNVQAGSGSHVIMSMNGDDILNFGNGDSVVAVGDGSNSVTGGNGDSAVLSGTGTDTITLGNGSNYVSSGDGADVIVVGDGNNVIEGGGGNDSITVGNGANLIDGGSGSDTFIVGIGNDTYRFGYGYGQDTLIDAGGIDCIALGVGIKPVDVHLWRDTSNLYIGLANDTDVLTISGWYDLAANRVESVKFVDGTVWSVALLELAVLEGTSGDDSLTGTTGKDVLNGFAGNDNLDGGDGDDTYVFGVGYGKDTITDSAGVDMITLGAGVAPSSVHLWRDTSNLYVGLVGTNDVLTVTGWFDATANRVESVVFKDGTIWNTALLAAASFDGTAGDDAIYGSTGNDVLNGLAGNDYLYGDAGNDLLDGGTGMDTMDGGLGNDTYIVDNVADVVTENLGEGTDLVKASVSYTLADNVENLTLTGATAINATGNTGNNLLMGNAADNILDGDAGSDTMVGGLGNDTYVVSQTGDVVTENLNEGTDLVQASVSYTLGANVENLTLTGASAINATGNAGSNVLTGNTATNILTGGAGNDTYVVGTGDTTIEVAGGGVDTVQSAVTWTLATEVENLTLTGTAAINATGNTLNNVLTGNSGNNALDGGLGADTMAGGLGNDTYVVDNVADVITENLNEGVDMVQSSISYTLNNNLENLTLTGTAAINATGNAGDNVLTGNSAANALTGGVGNDTYVVSTGDTTIEVAGGGIDTVQSAITWTLATEVENLTLTGTTGINGTGNSLDNILTGNSAANVLTGGAGNDTYVVGTGDTTIEAAGAGTDTVQSAITWTLATNMENLTLTGTAAVNGTGNTLNNVLTGNTANNTLDGGTGADTMAGGLGNDTYVVDNVADVVTEMAGEGTDLVQSSVTYTLGANVENLTLTGATAINATGNTLANTLTGNTGNNVLDGGLGADTMAGGTGNDTYYVDNTGDITTEVASAGTDTVVSSITWTLGTNLENLTLAGSANINATGNTAANVLTGNAGDNVLNGGTGADTMVGGLGNDTYVVDVATDVVTEGVNAGVDLVQSGVTYTLGANLENLTLTGTTAINGTGNADNNVLTGNAGANTLTGGAGSDTLNGGVGADALVGGTGNDTYWLGRGYGIDTITENDVTAGNTDLARFDAGIATDQLWFTKTGNNLDVSIIGTADKFTLSNWYLGNQYHVEQFKSSNGKTLLDSQVQNLVNAMAAFAPPPPGQTTLTAAQQTVLAPVIAANWL